MLDTIPLTPRLGPQVRAWLDSRTLAPPPAPVGKRLWDECQRIEGEIHIEADVWRLECETYTRFYIDQCEGRHWPDPPPCLDDPPMLGDSPYPGLDANTIDRLRYQITDWRRAQRPTEAILNTVRAAAWLGHQHWHRVVMSYLRGEPIDQPLWRDPATQSVYTPSHKTR